MAEERGGSEKLSRAGFRRAAILTATLVVSAVFLYMIRGFLQPLFLAAIFAGLLRPVYRRLVPLCRGKKPIASIATLTLALLLILGPTAALVGLVVDQALQVKDAALPWVTEHIEQTDLSNLQEELRDRFPSLEPWIPDNKKIAESLGKAVQATGEFLVSSLKTMTSGAAMFLLGFFVMLYAMFFYLIDGPEILDKIMGHVPLDPSDKDRILERFLSVTRATIKGTIVIGLIQGVLGGIAFQVAGLTGAAFWGAVMVVLSVIPGIGSAVVWVPAVIYLFVDGQPIAATVMALWFAAVVGTADNILRPILVGKDTQMPDLLILVSTLGGIAMFGIIGFITGPIVCALFLTSWSIYATAFRDALKPSESP